MTKISSPTSKKDDSLKRECGPCGECCKGTIGSSLPGFEQGPGSPCPKYCNGCTIYPNRPQVCRDFRCAWLFDPRLPDDMRPHESGVMVRLRLYKNRLPYWEIVECDGKQMSADVLNWFVMYALQNDFPIRYKIGDKWWKISNDKEFLVDHTHKDNE